MTLLVTTACVGCASKLGDIYDLKEVEETRGKCPWCGRFFASMNKYSYTPKNRRPRTQYRLQYKPSSGGGERNRRDED